MIELKTGIKMQVIVGKFITYTQLIADDGYCFYDKNADKYELQYYTDLMTPENDVLKLKEKYVAVLGNPDVLNQELAEKIQAEQETENQNR